MECGPFLILCVPQFVGGIVETISFATDPMGYIVTKIQQAVQDLMGVALPAVLNALHPSFDAEWWVDTYRVSFGLAMLTFFILVLVSFFSAAKRDDGGGRIVVENVFGFGFLFIAGSAFGPLLMVGISQLTTSLGDSLAAWGLESSTMLWAQNMAARFGSGDMLNVLGGSIMALVLLLVVLIALIGVLFLLIVQLASIYLMGALVPLGIVWLVLPRTRSFGTKAPLVFIGILFTHVLLFLMLGIGFRLLAGLGLTWGDGSTTDGFVIFVNMATTGVVMVMVALSPMGLLAIAKIANPAGGGGLSSDGGLSAPRFREGNPPSSSGSSRTNGAAEADTSTPTPSSSSPSSTVGIAGGSTAGAATAPSSAGAVANGGAAAAESGAASSTAASAGVGASAGEGAAVGGSAVGGSAVGGSAAAVGTTGAAASSTGVGAAVGIPLMVGAAAIAAANKAGEMAEATANQAAEAGTHEG